MDQATRIVLAEIFEARASAQQRAELRQVQELDRQLEERKEKKRREEEEDELFHELMEASARETAIFRERLEQYETAIVDALMENEQSLADARKRREGIEAAAYRLPDGRMAFKTEDGLRVFDQNGTQLAPNTISPDSIPDSRPRWEALKDAAERERKLIQEREELHHFQKQVDDAREELDKGGISSKRLDDLSTDLQRDMPEAVRQKLAGNNATPIAREERSLVSGEGIRAVGPLTGPSL